MNEKNNRVNCLVADTEQTTQDCFSGLSKAQVSLTLFSEKDNPEALKALIREARWDLIVIDPFTIDCTLSTLTTWLQHLEHRPHLVVASWADDTQFVDDSFKGGAVLYYIKPFTPDFPDTLVTRLFGLRG